MDYAISPEPSDAERAAILAALEDERAEAHDQGVDPDEEED